MTPPDPTKDGFIGSSGNTVPANGTSGYATGCTFVHEDGGAGTAFYVNEGTATSCAFVTYTDLSTAERALLSATAGTAAASKAVVLDASKDIAGLNDVSIGGTLTVVDAPVLTAETAVGTITLTTTKAPAGATAGKDDPKYITITIGATDYVIPAWPLA